MELFTIKDLSFAYSREELALEDCSLSVQEGELVLLLGSSGSGKTTFLKQLKPQLTPSGYRKGEVLYCGMPLSQVPAEQSAMEIGYLFQNPEHQIVTDKVWHEMAFGMENRGFCQREMELKMGEISSYFGIQEWFHSRVEELSGGQKQILNLAAILTMGPKVILLDEPTSQLDPIATRRFLQMLRQIKEELGITILLSEHHIEEVFHMADKIAVLEQGKLTYFGAAREGTQTLWQQNRQDLLPVSARVAFSLNSGQKEKFLPPLTVGEARRWLQKKEFTYSGSRKETLGQAGGKKERAIYLREVYFRYERQEPDVLQHLSLKVSQGECFGILGGNGTGKTTLLRLLGGDVKPYAGKVKKNGVTAYLPQNPQSMFSRESVEEELEGMEPERMTQFHMTSLMSRHPYDLSGGEQQRLALLLLLKREPDILLLDEPTKGLDEEAKQALQVLFAELQREGKTILIVSHDVEFVAQCTDRCGLLFDGQLMGTAPTREFFLTNQFYTTSLRRMTKGILKDMVLEKEVLVYGGNAVL